MDNRLKVILIRNARVHAPFSLETVGWVLIEGRKIIRTGGGHPPAFPADAIDLNLDASGLDLLPGMIDIHAHGAIGCETMDADPVELEKMAQFFASHGVTSFLAATWAAPHDQIVAALDAIKLAMGKPIEGAALLGAYLEGPYLNPKRAGAQPKGAIRKPDAKEYGEYLDRDVIRIAVMAPELPGIEDFIQDCKKKNIVLAAGHCQPSFEEMKKVVGEGVTLITHTFNGMAPFDHRAPGILGAAFLLPELSCELIADRIHIHPAAMEILYKLKRTNRIILMTDSVRPNGLEDGEYSLGGKKVHYKDHEIRSRKGTLAGSSLTMEIALRNFMQDTRTSIADIWQCSSANAARLLGISETKGNIEIGKEADLILLDEEFNVEMTMVGGRIVFSQNLPGIS
jgi:N-acetylglucosamine-6-phosphate deacetylase